MAFDKSAYMRDYWQRNRGKKRVYAREWRARNPYRDQENKYGMKHGEIAARLERQGYSCAICRQPFDAKPHVDHCHRSGRVRGLLCSPCNRSLGVLEKRGEGLLAYLREHNG